MTDLRLKCTKFSRWWNLQRSPRPPSWIWGPLRGRCRGWGREEEGKGDGRRGRGKWRGGKGRAPKLLLNQGPSEPCYATALWRTTTLISSGNTYILGKGAYLGVSHASRPKRAEFHGSPFWRVLLYLCLHTLTQNDQIRHGNTMVRSVF